MKKLLFIAICILLTASAASAHGNMDHILGTVVKIAGSVISVEKEGTITEVQLAATTQYEEAGHASSASNLKVGDRVVIHAAKEDGKEVAHEVRFSHPAR
jgi:hypothetical protein